MNQICYINTCIFKFQLHFQIEKTIVRQTITIYISLELFVFQTVEYQGLDRCYEQDLKFTIKKIRENHALLLEF